MNRNQTILGIIGLLVASNAYASDPTPLFVLFVGIPFIFLSVVFSLLGFKWPKASLGLLIVLVIAHVPVMTWASDVGYMDSAGIWLVISFFITLFGLGYSANKISKSRSI